MGGGGFALFFMGMKTATPSGSAIVQQLGIPLTALLSFAMLGERIDRRRGIGMFLTFVGAITVMWEPGGFSLTAGLMLIAGSLCRRPRHVLMKQTRGVEPMQFRPGSGSPRGSLCSPSRPCSRRVRSSAPSQRAGPFVAAVLYSA
jgi:hypothetical protein